jgi:metal-responsive CopG/Arc/MetJ family transcriptional regulator
MRININVDDELLAKIDDYAGEKYINRTSAICVLLSNALQANDINKSFASFKDLSELKELIDKSN